MSKRDSLPAGLERVFSEGHQYFDRVFWDTAVGQYWDRYGDVYLELSDLPRFGLAPRDGSPQCISSPIGWAVGSVMKYGVRCLRWECEVDGVFHFIEQGMDLAKSAPDPVWFSLFRWSDQVGPVFVAFGASPAELARRIESQAA